jgi:hypothetical protein
VCGVPAPGGEGLWAGGDGSGTIGLDERHHDVLRGLDHFQAAAAPPDPRLGDAVALLRSKRRSDGTWSTNAAYPGRYWFRLEHGGQPSRINTLRALRVLRWWN